METLVLRVTGMSCGGCAQRLDTVLRRVEGVREVAVDHCTGRVQVRVGPELGDRAVLGERIDAAGFALVADGEGQVDTGEGSPR